MDWWVNGVDAEDGRFCSVPVQSVYPRSVPLGLPGGCSCGGRHVACRCCVAWPRMRRLVCCVVWVWIMGWIDDRRGGKAWFGSVSWSAAGACAATHGPPRSTSLVFGAAAIDRSINRADQVIHRPIIHTHRSSRPIRKISPLLAWRKKGALDTNGNGAPIRDDGMLHTVCNGRDSQPTSRRRQGSSLPQFCPCKIDRQEGKDTATLKY